MCKFYVVVRSEQILKSYYIYVNEYCFDCTFHVFIVIIMCSFFCLFFIRFSLSVCLLPVYIPASNKDEITVTCLLFHFTTEDSQRARRVLAKSVFKLLILQDFTGLVILTVDILGGRLSCV